MNTQKPKKLKNKFLIRLLSSIVFAITLIGSIVYSPYTFFGFFLLVSILGINEFYRIVGSEQIQAQKVIGILSGVAVYASNFLWLNGWVDIQYYLLLIVLFVIIAIVELYRKKEHPFTNIAYTIAGIVYIAFPFSLLSFFVLETPEASFSPQILLGFIFLIWINDSGAYAFGSLFGKHKLFKRISPNKTWEGAIGGMTSALVLAYLLPLFFDSLARMDWIVISIIVVIIGTYGDLVESMLKRSLGIKDSGNVLPGHGGILDRFDSIILAAPLVFVYLQFI